MMPSNVMVVGALGACAQRNYYPALQWLCSHGLRISLAAIVDLESRSGDLAGICVAPPLQPQHTIFVPDDERDRATLSDQVAEKLNVAVIAGAIDTVIIVTEPKAHMAYLRWAIAHDLKILVEKPIFAPVDASIRMDAANQIIENFLELQGLLQSHPKAHLSVMTQRRYHSGYDHVRQCVETFVQEFDVPISFFDAYYSDGQWTLPDEFSRENHPFHHGYGKLHHGGYHFIDLLAEFVGLNDRLSKKAPDRIEVYTRSRRPADLLVAIGPEDYARLFRDGRPTPSWIQTGHSPEMLGEIDVFSSFAFRRGRNLVTAASLNLLHNGISRRSWRWPSPDTYKRNGRIRQEHLRIDVGPLLSIEIRSYEAHETEKVDPSESRCGVGWPRHFDVSVFRNSGVVGGAPYSEFRIGDEKRPSCGARTFVDEGRRLLIRDFFLKQKTRSDFESHLHTNFLMGLLALNLAKETQGQIPHSIALWPP